MIDTSTTGAAFIERFRQAFAAEGGGRDAVFGSGSSHGGGHRDVFIGQAPGPVEILGAPAEGIGGIVCAAALGGELGAAVAVQRRDDRRLVIRRYGAGKPASFSLSLDDFYGTAALLPVETLQALFTGENRWAAHVAGAFPVLARHKNMTRRTTGANIACLAPAIPAGEGDALACATLAALTSAYHLPIEPMETALLAQKIGHSIAGEACGAWAPIAATLGRRQRVLAVQRQPHETAEELPLPEGWRVVALRTDMRGASRGSGCLRARTAAAMVQTVVTQAIKDLGMRKGPAGGYLANVSAEHFQRYFAPMMPESITGQEFLEAYGAPADRLARVEPGELYTPRADAARLFAQSARARAFVEQLRAAQAGDPGVRHAAMLEARAILAANTDPLDGERAGGASGGGMTAVLVQEGADTEAEMASLAKELRAGSGQAQVLFSEPGSGAAESPAVRVGLAELLSR